MNIYLIISVISVLISGIIGFILGKYIIKSASRKERVLVIIFIGLILIAINYILAYKLDLNITQEAIVRGFFGVLLGFGISTSQPDTQPNS